MPEKKLKRILQRVAEGRLSVFKAVSILLYEMGRGGRILARLAEGKSKKQAMLAWTIIVLKLTVIESLAQSTYEPYTFTTLAGNAGSGSVDGTGSVAQFNQPSGVAADSMGNVYVADRYNHTIRKVTPAGVITTLAGLAGNSGSADGTASAARFSYPSDVAVDSTGNVYVADQNNSAIRKVTPTGVVTTLSSPSSFPAGVTVDSTTNVYVSDPYGNKIWKMTPSGNVTILAGTTSFGSNDGTGSAARFDSPAGVAVDSAGNVFVADWGNSTIRKVTPAGVVTTLAGLADNAKGGGADGTGRSARFARPTGVAVDSAGNVYVADTYNHTIRKVTPAGIVTTLAGLAGSLGNSDGTGSLARFNYPTGVAVDTAANVYVADSRNNTIRKGYPAPRILNAGPGFGFKGGQFGFNLTGPAGQLVVVEASTDLVNWLLVWTNTFAGTLIFSEPQSSVYSNRFYRVHLP